ncbi:uncharacterized protein K441DRAFT_581175, partial [Cenococcum geophilum 1.58]|uniref:uncharacterized protein n=1 Tax=Cenococcum geophilum 1.58 TaxID=794803 RepID=UPI00358E9BD4
CAYYYQHSILSGRFNITIAISASKRHLIENKIGYGYNKYGEIIFKIKKRKVIVLELLYNRYIIS